RRSTDRGRTSWACRSRSSPACSRRSGSTCCRSFVDGVLAYPACPRAAGVGGSHRMATQSKRANASRNESVLAPPDVFADRHLGPRRDEVKRMLDALGVSSLDELVDRTVPRAIRSKQPLDLPAPRTESETLADLADLAAKNQVFRSFLGLGYHDCVTPA